MEMPHPEGVCRAKELTLLIPEYESWEDQDFLCIRLQLYLLDSDYVKAASIVKIFGE